MSDLAEWLLTCIAEDEKTAPDIHHRDCESVQFDYGGIALGPCNCGEPVQVLAECAAKRAIVELHKHVAAYPSIGDTPPDFASGQFGCRICALNDRQIEPEGWCDTIRLLALPYADRDGYDPAWAPSIYGVAADGDPEGPSRRAATYGNLPARVVVPRRGNRTIAPVLPTGRREPRFVLFRP